MNISDIALNEIGNMFESRALREFYKIMPIQLQVKLKYKEEEVELGQHVGVLMGMSLFDIEELDKKGLIDDYDRFEEMIDDPIAAILDNISDKLLDIIIDMMRKDCELHELIRNDTEEFLSETVSGIVKNTFILYLFRHIGEIEQAYGDYLLTMID